MDRAGAGVACLVRARPGGGPGGSERRGLGRGLGSCLGQSLGPGAVWMEVWQEGCGSPTLMTPGLKEGEHVALS